MPYHHQLSHVFEFGYALDYALRYAGETRACFRSPKLGFTCVVQKELINKCLAARQPPEKKKYSKILANLVFDKF